MHDLVLVVVRKRNILADIIHINFQEQDSTIKSYSCKYQRGKKYLQSYIPLTTLKYINRKKSLFRLRKPNATILGCKTEENEGNVVRQAIENTPKFIDQSC